MTERVRLLNGNGIIFPDLANLKNIFYDYKNNKFNFIDYDGMQTWNSSSFTYNYSLPIDRFPIINSEKYGNFHNLYTANLDKFSLFILFFSYVFRIGFVDTLESFNELSSDY